MKDSSETKAAGDPQKAYTFVRAAIPFAVTMIAGMLLTAVVGLFVYANVVDAKSRDTHFVLICAVGTAITAVVAYFIARRTIESDPDRNTGSAFSLLKKYGRAAAQPGVDIEAGQYNIGESYLRELLGRRGA